MHRTSPRGPLLALIFFVIRVPETKGPSVEEVAREVGASEQQGTGRVPAG